MQTDVYVDTALLHSAASFLHRHPCAAGSLQMPLLERRLAKSI